MTSNNKRLIITALVFFLIVNTQYYWEGKLGLFAFPTFIILVIVYLGLVIALGQQIYLATKQKFRENGRLLAVLLLIFVLVLTYYKPYGLVHFEKFEVDDLLVAQREGSANCMIIFKLKDDLSFKASYKARFPE